MKSRMIVLAPLVMVLGMFAGLSKAAITHVWSTR